VAKAFTAIGVQLADHAQKLEWQVRHVLHSARAADDDTELNSDRGNQCEPQAHAPEGR